MLRVVGLMVMAAAVVACTGNSATSTSSVPSTALTTVTTAAETTTSSQATATTTAAPATTIAAEPPIPDTTGDDWTRIMTEIYAFIGWLYEHPDVELIEHIAVAGGEFESGFAPIIREYVENDWRDLPGGRADLREATLQSESGGQAVVLVIDDFDGATTVDADGSVAKEAPDRLPFAFLTTLQRDDAGRWRVLEIDNLGPVDGVDE